MCLLCTRHATARAKARKAARQRRLRRRLVGLNLRNGGEAPTEIFFLRTILACWKKLGAKAGRKPFQGFGSESH